MYQFVVFLHVFSVLAFLFAHGVSATVMFLLRRETDPNRIGALLSLRDATGPAFSAAGLVILVTGVIAGFMGNLWNQGWIGASLALFILLSIPMSLMGRRYLDRVQAAVEPSAGAQASASASVSLSSILATGQPVALAVIGFVGLAIILWLMLFKPF